MIFCIYGYLSMYSKCTCGIMEAQWWKPFPKEFYYNTLRGQYTHINHDYSTHSQYKHVVSHKRMQLINICRLRSRYIWLQVVINWSVWFVLSDDTVTILCLMSNYMLVHGDLQYRYNYHTVQYNMDDLDEVGAITATSLSHSLPPLSPPSGGKN